jgi:hypothetical protein
MSVLFFLGSEPRPRVSPAIKEGKKKKGDGFGIRFPLPAGRSSFVTLWRNSESLQKIKIKK